jgi:hypothetical protein
MSGVLPTFGISSQIEVDLDARLPEDPVTFTANASNAGLYIQFFLRGGRLYARVAGSLDAVLDFQSTL